MKLKAGSCVTGVLASVLLISGGCTPTPKSGKGFTLPEGDVARGKATYTKLQCNACHKIEGVPQTAAEGGEPALSVALGGDVSRIQTYGELVTSIINPSHRLPRGPGEESLSVDGESRMAIYNDTMTVRQLIDLVAFLQSKYKLKKMDPTDYPIYGL